MKFKLDENFSSRSAHLFREAGHDIATVLALRGADARSSSKTCLREKRCLLSLISIRTLCDFHRTKRWDRRSPSAERRIIAPLGERERSLGAAVEPITGLCGSSRAGRIRIHENTIADPSGGK
jgi:hypothetical protein